MRVLLLAIILFVGCKTPSDPIGVKILNEWHYQTIDACRGIDISDDVLVAAASSNGYFRFNISAVIKFYVTPTNKKPHECGAFCL